MEAYDLTRMEGWMRVEGGVDCGGDGGGGVATGSRGQIDNKHEGETISQ